MWKYGVAGLFGAIAGACIVIMFDVSASVPQTVELVAKRPSNRPLILTRTQTVSQVPQQASLQTTIPQGLTTTVAIKKQLRSERERAYDAYFPVDAVINGKQTTAVIDIATHWLTVPKSQAAVLGVGEPHTTYSVQIGGISFDHVPVRISSSATEIRLGMYLMQGMKWHFDGETLFIEGPTKTN